MSENALSLKYHKFFADTYLVWIDELSADHRLELVDAIMLYVAKGEAPKEVSDAIRVTLREQLLRVDGARGKYAAKCEVLAQNGAKGGKQKGINAAKARAQKTEPEPEESKSIPPPFKPLSKSDFLAVAKHWTPHAERSRVEDFYNSAFVGTDWKLDNELPVASNATVVTAICVALAEIKFFRDRDEDWEVFLEAYSTLKGDVPFPLFERFAKTYRRYHDKPGGLWSVNGEEYSDCSEAVDAFFDDG